MFVVNIVSVEMKREFVRHMFCGNTAAQVYISTFVYVYCVCKGREKTTIY